LEAFDGHSSDRIIPALDGVIEGRSHEEFIGE
jgi:hypothetical protein